jgi:hypothetical protein
MRPIFDAYIAGQYIATYQSLNRANAAIQRRQQLPGARGNVVVRRWPWPGSRALLVWPRPRRRKPFRRFFSD